MPNRSIIEELLHRAGQEFEKAEKVGPDLGDITVSAMTDKLHRPLTWVEPDANAALKRGVEVADSLGEECRITFSFSVQTTFECGSAFHSRNAVAVED